MRNINIDGKSNYFGHLLFAMDYVGKLNSSLFKKVDEQIEAMMYICLTLSAMSLHKKQKESCQKLWDYINKERKKDIRITKEILKDWPEGIGESIFAYYERKERKFQAKSIKSSFSPKYLAKLSSELKNLKYKMTDSDYMFCKEVIYQSVCNLFKVTSEFGLVPVLKLENIGYLKTFYPYFPEIATLPVAESQAASKVLKVWITLWEITKDEKILKEIDVAFDRMRVTESGEYNTHLDNLLKILKQKKEYENYLPKFKKFSEISSKIELRDVPVIHWSLSMDVLQKLALKNSFKNLKPQSLYGNLFYLLGFDMSDLEICAPLKSIYLDSNKTNINFVFDKEYVKNIAVFKDVWIDIIQKSIIENDDSIKKEMVDFLNNEYIMRLSMKPALLKEKIIKY
jgi:hypothetical protein